MLDNRIVEDKLRGVIFPDSNGKNIVDFGFIDEISITKEAIKISLDIISSSTDVINTLRKDIQKALAVFDKQIQVDIKQHAKLANAKKTLDNNINSSINIAPQIKSFLMVSSGKGGVGKSTVSVNVAISLASLGKKVGLLDADIYGPNIPRMLGILDVKPDSNGNKAKPILAYGIEIISIHSFIERDVSLLWRGPIIMRVVTQLLKDVEWSKLDILVIDMPPGTGDAQLTLAQNLPITGGLCVTTPQDVALDDAKRALNMFNKLNIPVIGVVENMSGFVAPDTNKIYNIFGNGGTDSIVEQFNTTTIGRIPINQSIREGGDSGKPISFFNPSLDVSKIYNNIAREVIDHIALMDKKGGVSNIAIQPK